MTDIVDEGKTQVVEGDSKTHPETVPWSQYVGLKEKFNKTEAGFKEQVSSLEERLKTAPSGEEFTKIQAELVSTKAEHQRVQDELKTFKDKSLSEKRETLKTRGVSDEDLVGLSDKELDVLMKTLGKYHTPGPDMGNGGGSGGLSGSPMSLAIQAYKSSK